MNAIFSYRLALVVAVTAVSLFPNRWSLAEDQSEHLDTAIAEQITRWIQQLDAAEFAARNEASRNLQQLGPAAFPALAETAVSGSREQRMRALEILGQHFQEGDDGRKRAAEEALKKVASSAQEASARRAKEILEPKKPPPRVVIPNIAPAQIQIQVQAIAGGVGGRGVPLPGIPANVPAVPQQWDVPQQGLDIRRQAIHRMLQSSRKMLESSIQQLEQTKGDGEDAGKIDESIQRLRDIGRQLEQEERKLAGQER
jgi:hypothetical protein